ncbi:MAG: adenylate/guanylate cyclase domain-containing protein, partial [Actinobacteria bacterium]|nr:adenylate/guanylate cyclase domain-containing protein [Actinomycetota bacterium]
MRCRTCGRDSPEGFRFCGKCGSPIEASSAPSAAHNFDADRRRVTILFADLVGFPALAEHLDPEELRALIARTFAELTQEVTLREGRVEKFIGDAVMATFGAPRAHEDDPERAVATALRLLEVVRRRSEPMPSPLQLRIGINSGLVIAGTVGDGSQTGVIGDAVNVAARLQQVAGPGEILVAASVWRRVRHGFRGQAIGPLELKGRAQPVEAFRIVGDLQSPTVHRTPFVGRHDELSLMELLWSSAAKGTTHV